MTTFVYHDRNIALENIALVIRESVQDFNMLKTQRKTITKTEGTTA